MHTKSGNRAQKIPITVETLAVHNLNITNDDRFARSQFQRESTQLFERVLAEQRVSVQQEANDPRLSSFTLYKSHDQPSSASPMERWTLTSLSNEPNVIFGSQALQSVGITEFTAAAAGDARMRAARTVAVFNEPLRDVSAQATQAEDETYDVVQDEDGSTEPIFVIPPRLNVRRVPSNDRALMHKRHRHRHRTPSKHQQRS